LCETWKLMGVWVFLVCCLFVGVLGVWVFGSDMETFCKNLARCK
jgi:hypothetical protein